MSKEQTTGPRPIVAAGGQDRGGQREPTAEWTVGVDLGGTNMRLGLYRGLAQARARRAAGEAAEMPVPVALHREKVGEPRDAETVATRLAGNIARLLAEAGIPDDERVPVGVGIAAMLRGFEGDVANSPHLRWRNVPFGQLLCERLGPRRPATLYNDVNAITYGEFSLGAGIEATDLLAVFVGTGIGGGLVAGGRLVEGASNCAGEIGHCKVAFGDDAPLCACGARGCVETFAGGIYLQRRIRAELAGGASSLTLELAGSADKVTPGHLDSAAAQGDAYALAIHDQIAPLLAGALANAICLLNPGCLVLGGGMLMRAPVLRQRVIEAMPPMLTRAQLEPLTIVDTALGDDAGLIGSALLAAEAG